MNKFNLLLVAGFSLFITACSEENNAKEEKKVLYWVAPMDATYRRDEPGKSPMGMDLVPVYAEAESEEKEKKILYWVAPMDATYRRDEPGKSPMGMDLVPVYDEGGDGSTVKISPAVENNMGVRTATVTKDKLWRRIDTVGYVDFDENKISHLHLRTKGWIEKLYVKSEGERVTKGQALFEVYAPELVNAQEEYLQALRSSNRGLAAASRERLIALGISAIQINQLNKTRKVKQYVKIYAKQNGIIAKLSIREGMFVTPQKLVMSLVDLSSVWLLAEVFEIQADWVRVGQSAEVTLAYLPGREWEGKVEYIYPSLDPKTRTLKVRLRFDNKDESLKPNMFAKVAIYGGAKREVLTIPREALIRSGNERRVIISVGDGGFQARSVKAGIESGEFVEIIEGLSVGDKVVTSGQFLIDSEASLKASIARMTSDKEETMPEMEMQQDTKIIGTGVVENILLNENKVRLSHGPITALDWPEMTMNFNLKESVSLADLNKGDKVDFELEKGDDGYVIKSITKSVNDSAR